VVAVSSSLLGMSIGFVMSHTLNEQFKILSGIPSETYNPLSQVLMIALSSTVCAAISTYRPVKKITDMRISEILRMA
jgi:ABC-type lipoprotein release transport system permease subunit